MDLEITLRNSQKEVIWLHGARDKKYKQGSVYTSNAVMATLSIRISWKGARTVRFMVFLPTDTTTFSKFCLQLTVFLSNMEKYRTFFIYKIIEYYNTYNMYIKIQLKIK